MAYQRDTEVELKGTFKDDAGVLTSPSSVTLQVVNPARVLTEYTLADAEVVEEDAGTFTRPQTLDASGAWYYRYKGSGNLVVAGWKRLDVMDDPFD